MTEEGKKKRNTAIFLVVATIINVLLMIVFMLTGYVLLAKYGNPDNPNGAQIWLVVIFLGSIGLSWFIYSRMIKWYTKHVDVEKKFAPLITPRRRKPKRDDDGASNMKG